MLKETIFNKIINRKTSTEIIYQDNLVTAFYDKYPLTPIHILIVSNVCIPTINDVASKDAIILGHMIITAKNIAKLKNIEKSGYRLIFNCNSHGGQEIFHLHMHLVGGRNLGPIISTDK